MKLSNILILDCIWYAILVIKPLAYIRITTSAHFLFLFLWNSFLSKVGIFQREVCFMEAITNGSCFLMDFTLFCWRIETINIRVICDWCPLISVTSLYLLYFLRPRSIIFPGILLFLCDMVYFFDILIWSTFEVINPLDSL